MKLTKIIFVIFLISNNLFANLNYFDVGLAFYNENKLEKAKFKFEQEIVYNPKSEKSYLYLSKIFKAQKKKELEEKNLKTVILLNPNNEEALYNLALLKLNDSDYKGSKKLVEQLISLCKKFFKFDKCVSILFR